MFQFFNRMKTIVSSELNAMIDKAEDPVKMLDQYLRDMGKDIEDVYFYYRMSMKRYFHSKSLL